MTYMHLTLDMFESAKKNGGYIDQTKFKTQSEFIFDTLVLSSAVINIIQTYVDFIRPRCHPTCDYLLVNTRGSQTSNLNKPMSRLTYAAIGKHINPTRWRQVIETESSIQLNDKEQETVSKDQKHSSMVAKRVYVKRKSREVAVESQQALKKLKGRDGVDKHDHLVSSQLLVLRASEENAVQISDESGGEEEGDGDEVRAEVTTAIPIEQADPVADPVASVITISSETEGDTLEAKEQDTEPKSDESEYSVEIKKEDTARGMVNVKFTDQEDKYLAAGVRKFGPSNWSKILSCPDYKFHPSRTRDKLRMRAKTKKLVPAKKANR